MAATVLHVSPGSYERLKPEVQKQTVDSKAFAKAMLNFGGEPLQSLRLEGVRLVKNPTFPVHIPCEMCACTGDGHDSTYCRQCKGAGRFEVDGAWFDRGVLTGTVCSYFPPLHEPRATFNVAPPTMRGPV